MISEIAKYILELKIQTAVIEEKVIALENYVIVDLKKQLEENTKKAETRFRWTIGTLVSLTTTSIGISVALSGVI